MTKTSVRSQSSFALSLNDAAKGVDGNFALTIPRDIKGGNDRSSQLADSVQALSSLLISCSDVQTPRRLPSTFDENETSTEFPNAGRTEFPNALEIPILSKAIYLTKSARWPWLGREGSNLRMAESKSAALPLGYAPTGRNEGRIDPLDRLRQRRSIEGVAPFQQAGRPNFRPKSGLVARSFMYGSSPWMPPGPVFAPRGGPIPPSES